MSGAVLSRVARALGVWISLAPALAFAQSSPSDFTSAVRYDVANRIVGTIAPDPDGSGPIHYAAVRNTYDIDGRLVRVEKGELANWQPEVGQPGGVDPSAWSGFTVFSQVDTDYDGMDRKIKETVSSGGTVYQVTQYSYDPVGRLDCTAVRMNPAAFSSLPSSACALGTTGSYGPDRITRNTYDDAGQLLKVTKAYGQTAANGLEPLQQDYVTYSYTPNGKQASVKDANGNLATYSYDGFDRLAQWNFPDKVAVGSASTTDYEAYSYDPNGNRLTLRKRDSSVINFTYDNLNRVTLKTEPGASVYYGYDLRGLQLYANYGSPTGAGVSQTYDGFGWLASSSNNNGAGLLTLTYQYDADGNRTRVTHPDGTYFVYDYDGLDRQMTIKENGTTSVATITYDNQGRRAGDSRAAATSAYGYDAISRLASLTDDLAGTADDVTTTFAYNPASQIATKTRSNDAYAFTGYANVSRSYLANGLNQYSTVGTNSYSYDANGNLTSDGGVTYTYDVENRLVTTSNGLVLAYDPIGRLWQTSGGASGTTRYLYDGSELIAEYSGSNTLLRRYVHGAGEDDPILWYEGAGLNDRRSLQIDGQGSIVSIANASGTRIAIDSYDEYGIPGGANLGRFQYTGQAWLPDLGMYYYKARIYAPMLGRFMQTDPVGYKDQVNLYAYVANDPTNGNDPGGLATVCAQTTGSIIGSCVGVDGNGNGDYKDNDLSFTQKQKISNDFHDAIVANSGKNISGLGKTVTGTASSDDKTMTRVVSQFVGAAYAREGGLRAKIWRELKGITANADQGLFSRDPHGAAFYDPRSNNITITGQRESILFGTSFYDSPSNLARLMLHEASHPWAIMIGDGANHPLVDRTGRELLKKYGMDGGGCVDLSYGIPGNGFYPC